jgi:hypothetical protein
VIRRHILHSNRVLKISCRIKPSLGPDAVIVNQIFLICESQNGGRGEVPTMMSSVSLSIFSSVLHLTPPSLLALTYQENLVYNNSIRT